MQRSRAFHTTVEPQPAPVQNPPSDRQVDFIKSLLAERELPSKGEQTGEQRKALALRLLEVGGMSKQQASKTIEWLLTLPRVATQATGQGATVQVPNGRYAIEEDGELRFFKVNTPTEGRWARFTFLDIQASDEFYPIKDRNRKTAILQAIANDPREAMLRYGREIGCCGHCGRTLTDEASRAAGIGPVCAAKAF